MLKIHGIPISVHTRKVIVTALHKGLAFEVLPVVPLVAESLPPNWRELSPTGRIPVLSDGDFHLADSAAICAYLERLHPEAPLYPHPSQVRDCARVQSLEQYAGALFAEVVQPLFHETFVNPNMKKKPADAAHVAALLGDVLPPMLGYLDGIARGASFFVGHSLSIADIAVASNLLNYRYLGFELDGLRYPHLSAMFERVLRQPALQQALRRELPVVESMGLRPDVITSALA
jgi:glutathione S-transferase